MSLHYILDGYNILKQVSRLTDIKIKDGRLGLIKMLMMSRQLKKQAISLVFDGFDDSQGEKVRQDFKVLFSGSSSADDKIRAMVQHHQSPRQLVVVTDDKEIIFIVKKLGANTLKVADFLFWISGARAEANKAAERPEADDKNLNYKQMLDINRELKKRWLHE